MYAYKIDGIQVIAEHPTAPGNEGPLYASLGIAAVLSFIRARPVCVEMNGQPYRTVSVEFVDQFRK